MRNLLISSSTEYHWSLAVIPQVFALGFVSVFDQVLEGLPDNDRESLFNAYISSLDEEGSKYRQVTTQRHLAVGDVHYSISYR